MASGKLPPGVLQIATLARQFEVSAVPVREALQQLAAEGLVTFEQYRRVIVNALSVDDMRDIFEIRLALEPLILEQAIPFIHDQAGVIGDGDDLLCFAESGMAQDEHVAARRQRQITRRGAFDP